MRLLIFITLLSALFLVGCTSERDLLRRHVADPLPRSLTILKSDVSDGKDPVYFFAVSCRADEVAALTSHPDFYRGDDSEAQYAVRSIRQGLGTSLSPTGVTVHLRSAHGGKARVVHSSTTTNIYIIIATRLSSG